MWYRAKQGKENKKIVLESDGQHDEKNEKKASTK